MKGIAKIHRKKHYQNFIKKNLQQNTQHMDGIKITTKIAPEKVALIINATASTIQWGGKFYYGESGEVIFLDGGDKAQYKGLFIKISAQHLTKEQKAKGEKIQHYYLTIEGSLQKFYLWNEAEKDDLKILTFSGLPYAILQICNLFQISDSDFKIQYLEISLTIALETTVSNLLNSIVAQSRPYQNKTQTGQRKDKKFDIRVFERTTGDFKLYDKGLQLTEKPTNLLRIEYRCKDMSHYIGAKNKIFTLKDLQDKEKVESLIHYLEQQIKDTIFIDYDVRAAIAESENVKALNWTNSDFWERIVSKDKRRNEKRNLVKFLEKSEADSVQKNLLLSIQNAWFLYMEIAAANTTFTVTLRNKKAAADSTFTDLEYKLVKVVKGKKNIEVNLSKNLVETSAKKPKRKLKIQRTFERVCTVCKIDISAKNHNAKTCSKTCKALSDKAAKRQRQKSKAAVLNCQVRTDTTNQRAKEI